MAKELKPGDRVRVEHSPREKPPAQSKRSLLLPKTLKDMSPKRQNRTPNT
jgi:hypothetical protein